MHPQTKAWPKIQQGETKALMCIVQRWVQFNQLVCFAKTHSDPCVPKKGHSPIIYLFPFESCPFHIWIIVVSAHDECHRHWVYVSYKLYILLSYSFVLFHILPCHTLWMVLSPSPLSVMVSWVLQTIYIRINRLSTCKKSGRDGCYDSKTNLHLRTNSSTSKQ